MKSFGLFFSIFFLTCSILFAYQVGVGKDHTLFLDEYGQMWASGNNNYGQLGVGGTSRTATPLPVTFDGKMTTVAAGHQTSYGIDSHGNLWAWGKNDEGELGFGHSLPVPLPTMLTGLPEMVRISPGTIHTLAVDMNGGVWQWNTLKYRDIYSPIMLDNLSSRTPIHSVLMKADGTLWIWQRVRSLSQPTLIEEFSHTFSIFQGEIASLENMGNKEITLYDSQQPWVISPQGVRPVTNACGPGYHHIASGFSRIFCEDDRGQLFAKGKNEHGELGLGHTQHQGILATIFTKE